MLSSKIMPVQEMCAFAMWAKAEVVDFDLSQFIEDPDAFQEEFIRYEQGEDAEQIGPYEVGHKGIKDKSTGITVEGGWPNA